MADVSVKISGPTGNRTAILNPHGSTLGRGRLCDIILNHDSVSRLHARIYRDVVGSWKIEDVDSQNGVVVDGQQVDSQNLTLDNKIEISVFTLTLQEDTSKPRQDETPVQPLSSSDRHGRDTVISYRPKSATVLGSELLSAFNSFTDNLLKMMDSAVLYAQACRHLEELLGGSVTILRLSLPIETLGVQPEVLASQIAQDQDAGGNEVLGPQFSQSVLKAACTTEEPVMTQSHPTSEQDLALTIVNKTNPRVVFAAPVNKIGDTIDLLYVDLPEDKMSGTMFDFIEAISRQINFVQKSLFYRELQKTEQALREANRELQDKDRIKDEYVSRITHDIKGHLGVIKSCLGLADEKSGIGSPEKKAEFLERASGRTTQLLTFIADLLQITKLRLSGQAEVKSFSLKAAILKSLETVSPGAKEKHIDLESNVAATIDTMTGDELSITEVVTNLLFNAIKYSPEHEKVALTAEMQNDGIIIAVSDTGIGIPEDEIDQVFNEFFRARNAVAFAKDGSGLGLALVKQIVERHGGTITAKNNTGKGATFSIILPSEG